MMMKEKPVIICMTPVRNESWILDMFLECTSLWADHIIIADQNSTDGSKEIALRYPKVRLVENLSGSYDEFSRQKLLINEARKIPGKRLLIALDADEVFTADFGRTNDWERIVNAEPGEVFGFRWVNICSDFSNGWQSEHFGWALMDDGSEHQGKFIHSPRVPIKSADNIIKLEEIKVLHYQYINWSRMLSKHRYYQCLERINYSEKKPVSIFRMYHHMLNVKKADIKSLEDRYFSDYEKLNIPVREMLFDELYWFDEEVLKFFVQYGEKYFKKEAIWGADWNRIAQNLGFPINKKISDPRKRKDKLFHTWLNKTQKYHNSFLVRKVDNILNRLW